MFKALFRFFSYVFTSFGFAIGFVDGVRTIDTETLTLTSVKTFLSFLSSGEAWDLASPNLPEEASNLFASLLGLPASIVFLCLGILFMLVGRKSRLIAPEARTK